MGACSACLSKKENAVHISPNTKVLASPAGYLGDNSTMLRISSRVDKQKGPLVHCRSSHQSRPSEALRGTLIEGAPNTVETARLLKAFQVHFTLKHLETDSLLDIIKDMKQYEVGPRQIFVQQGDPADYLFVINRGEADVVVDNVRQETLRPVSCFGEAALLDDAPRPFSVKCVSRSFFWVIDRFTFKQAVQRVNEMHHDENMHFLDTVELFQNFSSEQKEQMLKFFHLQEWNKGQKIVKEGDRGNSLFIITEGTVACTYRNKELRVMNKGDVFGEQALLNANVRTATVTAKTAVKLLMVSADHLERCFGDNLERVIYRNSLCIAFERSPVLKNFTNEQVSLVMDAMGMSSLSKGTVVVPRGTSKSDCLRVLIKGTLVTSKRTYSAFCCIGDNYLFAEQPSEYTEDLVAGSDTIIGHIRCSDLEQVVGGQLQAVTDQNQVLKALAGVPLFKHLPKSQLQLLASSLNKQKHQPGEVIVEEGSTGDCFYVIKSGSADIIKAGTTLRTLGPLSYFGERALLLTEPRSASVVATSVTICWEIHKDAFMHVIDDRLQDQLRRRIELQDDSVTLDQLRPMKLLGTGMTSQVYLCVDAEKSVIYALKSVKRSMIEELQLHEGMLNERKILLTLDHPMIMRLVKTFKDESRIYFLTEFVNGQDMFDALRSIGNVTEQQSRFYTACLMLILEHLHSKSIVYRDLKPENVMVDHEGYAKLIDMGAATIVNGRTYTSIGTPHYMAPEAIVGAGYDLAVDYWSLGIMVYEFLYGDVPFGADKDDPQEVFKAVLNASLKFPTGRNFPRANKFIECLLQQKPCLRANGNIKNLKVHNWLSGFDWEGLLSRRVAAGYVPRTTDYTTRIAELTDDGKSISQVIREKEGNQLKVPLSSDWDACF